MPEYRDRKMLKWLPFEALPEQRKALETLAQRITAVERPRLSEDALATLQHRFEAALAHGMAVSATVFEAGRLQRVDGLITAVDWNKKRLCIDKKSLFVADIIDLRTGG